MGTETEPKLAPEKPADQLTVPVKPAALTVLNLATTAAATAATSGTVGLALLAGLGIAGVSVSEHHRTRTNKKLGRTSGRRKLFGGRTGISRGMFGGRTNKRTNGRGLFGGRTASGRTGTGRGLFGGRTSGRRLFGGRTNRRRLFGGRTSGRTGTGRGLFGGRTANRGLFGGRTSGRTNGRGLSARAANVRGMFSRAANGRNLFGRTHKLAKRTRQGTLAALRILGLAISQAIASTAWALSALRKLAKPDEQTADEQTDEQTADDVADTVREPNQPSSPEPKGAKIMSLPDVSQQSPLFMIMKKGCDEAMGIGPHKGAMATRAEAYDLPVVLRMVAEVVTVRANHYRRDSIQPEFVTMLTQAASALFEVADYLGKLGPAFDDLHHELLSNLFDSPNPETWDTHNNQTVA